MSRILLVDFKESESRQLQERKFDLELRETNWKSGRAESLRPPQGCRVVLYQANVKNEPAGLHEDDAAEFERMVEDGGAVICFIGDCREFHITGLVGDIPHLRFEANELPDKILAVQDEPFSSIFSRYRAFISHAFELFPEENNLGKVIQLSEWDPPGEGELLVLAESIRKRPVSVMLRKGKGFYLLLPWFGEKNIEVAAFVLDRVLPELAPQLTAHEEDAWLDSYDYIFPALVDVFKQMEDENVRHRQTMRELEGKIDEIKAAEQEPFNQLLIAEGKDLQQAVIKAFRYLDWTNVVDVNEYWKRVIRVREEDIWLLEGNEESVETLIRDAPITMIMVRSGKTGAAEEDCLLLQRFKGRRMQEFNNTRMKALLIGNYFIQTEAKLREVPFSENQIGEAAKDGNGLLTTYELFKAVKAEKEGRITKEDIRQQLVDKVGLITFDY
ncbi:MAG: hypothetical protein JXE07_06420 [Candidatus Aminicenantes bacterium]|nr:hypothetical protein [Candidatus Aminicenantes bacterium]